MKKFLFCLLLILLAVSCSGKNNVESKWRVLDEEPYNPKIDESRLFTSLDELEKLIVAPVFYFRDKNGVYSFSQTMTYETKSVVGDAARKLVLNETAKYKSDKTGNFSMSYQNNKNEGWDIVWRNNFFYRKQFGGEFTKTFSMGEHIALRDNVFGTLPTIYIMMRDHAVIKSEKSWKIGNYKGHLVTVAFGDKAEKRANLPEKKYLQNLQGTEEMRDDDLVKDLSRKKKTNIVGAMTVFVALDGTVVDLEMDLSFDFAEEGVSFSVKGKRTLSQNAAEAIGEPDYNEEYHRRTLDSSVNIMKKKIDVKEEENDEK